MPLPPSPFKIVLTVTVAGTQPALTVTRTVNAETLDKALALAYVDLVQIECLSVVKT